MKTQSTLIVIILLIASNAFAQKIPVVKKAADLEQYVGQKITIKGMVQNSKQAQIIGVDIETSNPDLRGKKAKATGVLKKHVVKQEDVDPFSANRGAGTFYRLVQTGTEWEYSKAYKKRKKVRTKF